MILHFYVWRCRALTIDNSQWKRFFSVPCALVDNYLKLADGPALKLFLYLISLEGPLDERKITDATGLNSQEIKEAEIFWKNLGIMSSDTPSALPDTSPSHTENTASAPSPVGPKIVHSHYQPKDIAEMLSSSPELKELFSEAESTLGRILKHSDHEVLISLRDYYGFSEQAIVLILEYCAGMDKTSARYYETVAKSLFDKGAMDFDSIEEEFSRLKEQHSYENQIRHDFGLEIRLTPKQIKYINSWRDMGFDLDMINLARERCADSANKLSFPYIDRILHSWKEKNITTVEAAQNESKPANTSEMHSFDLDEFDRFTLGAGKD